MEVDFICGGFAIWELQKHIPFVSSIGSKVFNIRKFKGSIVLKVYNKIWTNIDLSQT